MLIFIGAVAHHIVDVAVDVHLVKDSQIFEDALEIFEIGLRLCFSLIKSRKVGVLPVDYMGGADDEIKGPLREIFPVPFSQMRL